MKYQYTIEGNVIQGPGIDDSAGYLSALGISVGSKVSYTFIIDLSAPGTIQDQDGTTIHKDPPRKIFYAHYISGSTITSANYIKEYTKTGSSITSYDYGGADMPDYEYWLYMSNGNNFLNFMDMLARPDEKECWPGGSNFGCQNMQNIIYDASGKKSSFYFNAKVTQIWQESYTQIYPITIGEGGMVTAPGVPTLHNPS
jgi:hypothetical protein